VRKLRRYRSELEAVGHVVTSRWLDGDHQAVTISTAVMTLGEGSKTALPQTFPAHLGSGPRSVSGLLPRSMASLGKFHALGPTVEDPWRLVTIPRLRICATYRT
jgi:hypothetical protein